MAYTKTQWNPGGPPGISAENLNKIEQGIADAHDIADTALTVAGEVASDLDSHKNDIMPHKFTDGAKTYRWGFRIVNGQPQFIYEEVTE